MSYLLNITEEFKNSSNSELGLKAHRHWDEAVHRIASLDPQADTAWGYEVALEGAFYGTPKVYHSEVGLGQADLDSLKEWGFKPFS